MTMSTDRELAPTAATTEGRVVQMRGGAARPGLSRLAWSPVLRGAIGALLVFGLCEIVTRSEPVSREFLPYASDMLRRVPGLLVDSEFLSSAGATMLAASLALLIATGVAVPLGVALGSSEIAYRISRMMIELLRPIPSVTLIPLLVLLVGPELEMKVFIATYAALWPILFNTIYSMHDVDPVSKDTARAFGLSRWNVLVRVSLPSAAPLMATGVRVSAGISLMVVISAEILTGGSPGIGSFIKVSSAGIGQAPTTFAAAIIAGVIGFLINAAFQGAEGKFFAWSSRERRAA